ncbi:MAG: conjugal transfer protein MobB [Bacteroidales bacterium]
MVAKISHGASLYGALVYNHEKVLKGAAEILSGNRMISDRPGMPSEDMRLVLLSFENHLIANRRTDKPVLHISLSPAPEDRMDNGRLAELADKYMQKMGYGNQPFIVYKHGDTCHPHVHIVSVCTNDEGRKINDSYEHRRSMSACRELEQEFGLRNSADTEERNPKAELKKVDVSQGDIRHQIGNTLKAVLESYRFQTFGEFSALLSTLNIEARQVRGEYKGTPYIGIVYSATDENGKTVSPPIKSARFGKRFGDTGLSGRMLRHTQDFKEGKWAPAISGKVIRAMRNAGTEQEFRKLLKQDRIDIVFRKNEAGRIYGVTFIDHDRREVFNGSRMGKEFSANTFNELVHGWNEISQNDRKDLGRHTFRQQEDYRQKEDGVLEQAAGIFSMETNPAVDYEEEAFRRRMKRKKKHAARHKSRGI